MGGFASRFGRVADIFMTRYLRTCLLIEDPGYSGTLRDTLNESAKRGLIDDPKKWLAIRELRNLISQEYAEEVEGQMSEKTDLHAPPPSEIGWRRGQ